MWENIVERSRPQMTKWRIRIACWMPQSKRQPEYVIIIAFSPHERTSMLRYTYTTCLVYYCWKVKLSLFNSRRRKGGEEIEFRLVVSSSLNGSEWSGSRHYRYPAEKKGPDKKPTGSRNRSGCVWKQEIPGPPGNRTAIAWSYTS